MINWKVSEEEANIISQICVRGYPEANRIYPNITLTAMNIDVVTVHAYGCPLRLSELLDADNYDFFHDLFGIINNLNRKTGKLENFFFPRYMQGEQLDTE